MIKLFWNRTRVNATMTTRDSSRFEQKGGPRAEVTPLAAVCLCLRISVQWLLGGVGVHAAPVETHLDYGTPFLEEH